MPRSLFAIMMVLLLSLLLLPAVSAEFGRLTVVVVDPQGRTLESDIELSGINQAYETELYFDGSTDTDGTVSFEYDTVAPMRYFNYFVAPYQSDLYEISSGSLLDVGLIAEETIQVYFIEGQDLGPVRRSLSVVIVPLLFVSFVLLCFITKRKSA